MGVGPAGKVAWKIKNGKDATSEMASFPKVPVPPLYFECVSAGKKNKERSIHKRWDHRALGRRP